MSWRPEGWENPYNKPKVLSLNIPEGTKLFRGDFEVLDTSAIVNSSNEANAEIFEAGADAMLEALRAKGADDLLKFIYNVVAIQPLKTIGNGKFLFIPDEEVR